MSLKISNKFMCLNCCCNLGWFFVRSNFVFAAPTTIAAFEMAGLAGNEATFNATTNDVNLQTVVVSRGVGVNPAALANAFSSNAFFVGGTKADAISNGEYIQVEIEPKNSNNLFLNTINFNLRRSGTGPNAYQWQYSLDGFATAGIDVGAQGSYIGTETNGLAMPAIDLTGVTDLQNVLNGNKVTFRLYAWGATGAAGTFALGRLTGDDLAFVGTVSPNFVVSFDPDGQNGDEATFGSTTEDLNVQSSLLRRGDGIDPSVLLNAFSSTGYMVGGDKDDAINNNEYIELKVEAKDYYVMDLDGLTFNIRRSGTGPNAYQWQYSFDDFATSGTDLGAEGLYNGTDNNGLLMPAIALSGIPDLQSIKTVTFRLYAWGATGSAGTFAVGRLSGDDLIFTGNVLLNKIVAFDPAGQNGNEVTFDATTLNSRLNNSILTRGAGIIPSFLLDAFSSKDYVAGGVKTDATGNDEYMQFEIEALPGYNVSLGTLDYNLRRSITGPNVYQWQYSLDGFTFRAIDIGPEFSYTTTVDTGTSRPQIDLSLPELQNVRSGNTVSLRLYAWGATNASGTFAFARLAGDDIYIMGETAANVYSFDYTAGANGSLTGTTTQMVNHGSDGTAVTAVPDAGYSFVDWSDSSTANPRTDLNAADDISVTANFTPLTYTVDYTAGANGSVTGSTTQMINHGSDGTAVTAVPNAGYNFVDWSDSSTVNPRTDTNVTGNLNLFANFVLDASSLSNGGPGAYYLPPGIGSGREDRSIAMDAIKDVGVIDEEGLNILAYVRSRALFRARNSIDLRDADHSLKILAVGLYTNVVTIEVASEPQTIQLNSGEKINVDLDGDKTPDVSVQFMGVYVNRVELTLKSLLDSSVIAENVDNGLSVSETSGFVFTQDLMTGMINEDVRQLQIFLNSHGFAVADTGPGSSGNETDKFGAGTRQALIGYQEANKLTPAVGYFGPDTRKLVNAQLNNQEILNNNLADRLQGRILLQVQDHGEAWYVRMSDSKKYYMKDGGAAYEMMRYFSKGITDADLLKIPKVADTTEMNKSTSVCSVNSIANRLKGEILLQVNQNGEAWYVDPVKCRSIYMKDGGAAYDIMKYLGLGILNSDLNKIQTGVFSR